VIAFVLATLVAQATPAPASTTAPTLDPYAIYAAARHQRTEAGYPRYAVYDAVVHYTIGNKPIIRTWDTVEDLQKRLVFSHGISKEEQAHPETPEGTNIGVGIGSSGVQTPQQNGSILPGGMTLNDAASTDPLGQVTFAVNQDFGIALNAPPISQTQDLVDISTTKPFLPHIGSTAVVARTYTITNLGNVTEKGRLLYHLALMPVRDPDRYRLRELWIDAKTYDVVHAKVSGIGNGEPFSTTAWLIDFRQWEGGTYIERETALDSLQDSGETCYNVVITFEDVTARNSLNAYEQVGITSSTGIADP
jgi:hypothetical protein